MRLRCGMWGVCGGGGGRVADRLRGLGVYHPPPQTIRVTVVLWCNTRPHCTSHHRQHRVAIPQMLLWYCCCSKPHKSWPKQPQQETATATSSGEVKSGLRPQTAWATEPRYDTGLYVKNAVIAELDLRPPQLGMYGHTHMHACTHSLLSLSLDVLCLSVSLFLLSF